MTVAVKICGLKTPGALDAALAGGADYVGLVVYPRSPRHVEIGTGRALADRARGRAQVVVLLVDPDDAAIDEVLAGVRPDLIQLHGNEDLARVAAIGSRTGVPLIKAVKVATADDACAGLNFADHALVLFDAKAPQANGLPGGNGEAFDWTLLRDVQGRLPFMLSGGLTVETVAAAIRVTGAGAVDVSSGVETRPGEKDPALIRRFLRAAKTAMQPASSHPSEEATRPTR